MTSKSKCTTPILGGNENYQQCPVIIDTESNNTPNGEDHGDSKMTLSEKGIAENYGATDENGSHPSPSAMEYTGRQGNGVATIDVEPKCPLLYKVTETPPPHLLLFFGLQQGLLAIATPLTTVFIVAEIVCVGEDDEIKTRLLSSTFFMIGLSTFTMTTLGIRLPIFQGPNFTYVLPLISMMTLKEFKCPAIFDQFDPVANVTTKMVRVSNGTDVTHSDFINGRINELAGSLMLVGVLHFLIGATGLVGTIGRYVGPITIVPIVLLFGISINPVVAQFTETHWPTASLTSVLAIILALYLQNCLTPIPCWTPSKGFFISWQNIHNVFAIIASIVVGWIVCLILTQTDCLSDDPNSKEFQARTDSKLDIIKEIDWILFPYPGQFGVPKFSLTAAITFFIATILSVIGSVGDYCTAARIACVPQPPNYALNRGIAVEGLMVFLGGAFGCGHGTVSFSENNGAMKISRVASRSVYNTAAVVYLVFSFIGKIGAFFITIPHSVMGGSQVITFGMLIGVTLSILQVIDLNSTRNLSILGITAFVGLMVPGWMVANQDVIDTGNHQLDTSLQILLTNPSFIGGILACVLDNTVPGTKQERGIRIHTKTQGSDEAPADSSENQNHGLSTGKIEKDSSQRGNNLTLLHGNEIYRLPWLPDRFRKSVFNKFVPIFDCDIPKTIDKSKPI